MPSIQILDVKPSNSDSLRIVGFCSGILAVFLLMAGIAQMPVDLGKAAIYEIRPSKFLRNTFRLGRNGVPQGRGEQTRLSLVGINESNTEVYFGFPDEPTSLELFDQIVIGEPIKLWVERNDFAKVIQLQQGSKMILSHEQTSTEKWSSAQNRFIQSAIALAFGVALFLFGHRIKNND